ncbi:hypothetical protein [Streptosporangium sp. NPDC000239]|uniref:Uncharacterized protein n=1 Tax=Streptosporangium jomthongense TaxID=1193683 RepID=A0ABV8EWF3_9ACTN
MSRVDISHTFVRTPGRDPEDDRLLALLVTTWVLVTGRVPPDRPFDELSADELFDFWADDQTAEV